MNFVTIWTRRQISPLPVDGDENSTSTTPYEELIL
jgi:hypothetical protein